MAKQAYEEQEVNEQRRSGLPFGSYSLLSLSLQTSDLPKLPRQVLGVPGEDLNYEETVVYNNDAIRPAFLIVYGDAPPVPPKPIGARRTVRRLFTTPLVS